MTCTGLPNRLQGGGHHKKTRLSHVTWFPCMFRIHVEPTCERNFTKVFCLPLKLYFTIPIGDTSEQPHACFSIF